MDFQSLKNEIAEFVKERDWEQFHNPKNLAMALSVEASEMLEIFQWLSFDEARELSDKERSKVEQEIGDILICLTNLAAKFGIDPLDAAHNKLKLNRDKYPVEKAKGRAVKYDQL
jgi:NTP pyrophosphatase (non-canonical NTP hydrolase)